ncbi:GNAT family N-acetyltransferase [Nocardiopsis lucentensis]|uniref:GNAT family N-acetyltransferase n=1 Tax=Nocardiopsis lucentensis TaxID=53441 RepID=UPI000345ABBB|nr:GNAT family N-acetyltransferase [Nocardiopsis lucentensis]
MSSAQFVRPARAADVDAVVAVQVASWRSVYGELLPDEVLEEMGGGEARERFREQWSSAVASPPTSRHRLVVATDEEAGKRTVVGFAAFGPAGDPDLWPGKDAEVFALHVAPELTRRGHGSRLLNACVDQLVESGFGTVYVWVPEADNALRSFFESSGWRADGARREIDLGSPLAMVRLHAAITA